MAWVDISSSTYKEEFYCPYQGGISANYKPYVTLQYDNAKRSPTSVTLRFKFTKTGTNGPPDMYYVLMNPTSATNRALYTLKGWYGQNASKWPLYSESFEITKTYTAGTFTIPAYWICNDGNNNTSDTATAFYNQYNDDAWRGQELKRAISAQSIAIDTGKTVATAVTAYKPTISDNYNATLTGSNAFSGACTIEGRAGRAGTNNSVDSTTLQYKIGTGSWTDAGSLKVDPLTLTASSGNTITVKARTVVAGKYGNAQTSDEETCNVTRYAVPSEAGEPTLHDDSFKNKRLILKHNWKWTWTASTASTTASPVKGYRIQLKRRRPPATAFTAIAFKDLNGKASDSYNAMDISTNYFEMNPLDCDLQPGDEVSFAVKAFTQVGSNNTGTKLFRDSFKETSTKNVKTVQNAGVLRYKPTDSGEWKEAVVWYKKSNTEWVEAEVVKYKPTDSGEWKEST